MYFDEPVKKKVIHVTTEQLKEAYHIPDNSGFLVLALESELYWSNIEKQQIITEASAIINEEDSKLKAGIKNFFDKIIEFFKTLWEKFVQTVRRVRAILIDKFSVGAKLLKLHDAAFKAAKNKYVKNVYTWNLSNFDSKVGTYLNSTSARGIVKSGSVVATVDNLASSLIGGNVSSANMQEKIMAELRSAERKDVNISNYKKFIKDVLDGGYRKSLRTLNAATESMKTMISDGMDAAKKGKNATDEQRKVYTIICNSARNATTYTNKVSNVFISALLGMYADAMKGFRVAVPAASAKAVGKGVKKGATAVGSGVKKGATAVGSKFKKKEASA